MEKDDGFTISFYLHLCLLSPIYFCVSAQSICAHSAFHIVFLSKWWGRVEILVYCPRVAVIDSYLLYMLLLVKFQAKQVPFS